MSQDDADAIECLFEADGGDGWTPYEITLRERLDGPFELLITLVTETIDAQAEGLLGKRAKLTMTRGKSTRAVSGIVAWVGVPSVERKRRAVVEVHIRPAFDALRQRFDTRVFQEKTVPEILDAVLGDGLGAYGAEVDARLERTYRPCDYRVQYDESDFAFASRLMEEEGITYWFELDGDTEKMVLADAPGAFGEVETQAGGAIPYHARTGPVGGYDRITELLAASRLRPTKVKTRHFDWRTPSRMHEAESDVGDAGAIPNGASLAPVREVYEHDSLPLTSEPGGTTYAADKDDQAAIRREGQRRNARVANGVSSVLDMRAGATFELREHGRADLDGEYLVIDVTHRVGNAGHSYENGFFCLPKEVPYRPARITPRPSLRSIQTAVVVGPAGEEIHTDEHGRIKVQFPWDRLGASDEHSSCWVRVQQPWAGAGFGFVFIPRIGMEVVVDFVSGDPDRPLVLGCVYNGDNLPPYPLPDEKTKSTIKTNSSLGGGGYNELRFEDKAGSEEIFIHAQKDFDEVVENNHTTTVHHDQTIRVDNDQTQEIGNNQTEHIFVDQTLTVDANRTITVHGNFTETIDGSETRTVTSGSTETIDAGETRTVTGGMTESISGGRTQSIDGSSTETITGSLSQSITGGVTIKTPGSVTLTALGGLEINAAAGTMIQTNTYMLVAPAGNTHHDAYWTFLAKSWTDNFAIKIDVTPVHLDTSGVKISLNSGFYLQTKGLDGAATALRAKTWTINGDTSAEKAEAKAVDAQLQAWELK